jgi:hypothetical protein
MHPLGLYTYKNYLPDNRKGIMRPNTTDLPYLDPTLLKTIFANLEGNEEGLAKIKSRQVRDFIEMLLAIQKYNVKHRSHQIQKLFPMVDEETGPFEPDKESTVLWVALVLAIKELYGMRTETLKTVLKKFNQ